MAMRRRRTSRLVDTVPIAVLVAVLIPGNLSAQTVQGRTTGTDPATALGEVLDSYMNALRALPEGIPDEQEIPARERAVRVAMLLTPRPAIPPEAEQFVVRGNARLQGGTDVETLQAAAREFRRALRVAPWFGAALLGLAVVEGNQSEYDAAIANLNLYALTNPADARQARSRIAEFEVRRSQPTRGDVPVAPVAPAIPPPPSAPAYQPPPAAPAPPPRAAAPASQPPPVAAQPTPVAAAPQTASSSHTGKKVFFLLSGAGLLGGAYWIVRPYTSNIRELPKNQLIQSAVLVGVGAGMVIGGIKVSVSALPGGIAIGGQLGLRRPRTQR